MRPAPAAGRLGPWWSPWTWWLVVKAKWDAGDPLTKQQKRGFAFWAPVGLAIGAVELAGALSGAFRNFIPWPTISSTIGHIEEVASWVGVIVVAVIAMVAYFAVTHGLAVTRGIDPEQQTDHGRLLPPNVDMSQIQNVRVKRRFLAFRYDWIFVFAATAVVAFLVNRLWSDDKLVLGYSIYGSFLVFGILFPTVLLRWAHLSTPGSLRFGYGFGPQPEVSSDAVRARGRPFGPRRTPRALPMARHHARVDELRRLERSCRPNQSDHSDRSVARRHADASILDTGARRR